MSNYTKSTNFATKDALASGNALKIVKGTEIDTEFNNIATAVATKADTASPTFTGTPTLPTGTIAVTQTAGNNTTAIATTAFVTAGLQAAYPVGAIFLSTVSTNPSTLLGFGTWVAYGSGRMLISQDATYTAGSTGGSATTTLITANLPAHTHTATVTDPGHTHTHNAQQNNAGHQLAGGGSNTVVPTAATINSATTGITVTNSSTGSGTAVSTISPYIAVYMWNRTV